MGQPVTVVEKPSAVPGVLRFETNRTLTGMGHEIYRSVDEATGATPGDELARRLFARGGVESLHLYSNVITVHLADGSPPQGIRDVIASLYTFYTEGVVPEVPEGAAAD
jgi:hypothetical protein